jgi:hypothetical protein
MTEPNRMPTRALDVQHVSALRFVPGCTLSRLKQSHPGFGAPIHPVGYMDEASSDGPGCHNVNP